MAAPKVAHQRDEDPCTSAASSSSLKQSLDFSRHQTGGASASTSACTCQFLAIASHGGQGDNLSPRERAAWETSEVVFQSCRFEVAKNVCFCSSRSSNSSSDARGCLDGMEKVVGNRGKCEMSVRLCEMIMMEPLVDPALPLPRRHSVRVPHVRQSYSWDCGLACVLMVLQSLGVHGCTLPQLRKLCSTTSIWTVDLAHLLRHFKMEVTLLTITIGANPSFAGENFYKDNMRRDERRVNRLFESASSAGISLQRRSITGEELACVILSQKFLAIALIDKRKLVPLWTDDFCIPDFLLQSSSYTGHYIVICGYDTDSREFEIRDPANNGSGLTSVSMQVLDEARKAFGTDEDLLLVSLGEPENRSNELERD